MAATDPHATATAFLRTLAPLVPVELQAPPAELLAALRQGQQSEDERVRTWAAEMLEAAARTRPPDSVGEAKSMSRRLTGWRHAGWVHLDLVTPDRVVHSRRAGGHFLITRYEFVDGRLSHSHSRRRADGVAELEAIEPVLCKIYGRWEAAGACRFDVKSNSEVYQAFGYHSPAGYFGWLQDLLEVDGAGEILAIRDQIEDAIHDCALRDELHWTLLRYLEYLDWTSPLEEAYRKEQEAGQRDAELAIQIAESRPKSMSGDAYSLLRRVRAAYGALQTLQSRGEVVIRHRSAHFPETTHEVAFTLAYSAPSRFRLETSPVTVKQTSGGVRVAGVGSVAGYDGRTAYRYVPDRKTYAAAEVPCGRWTTFELSRQVPDLYRRPIVGDPQLLLALFADGADALVGAALSAEQSADRVAAGRPCLALGVARGTVSETYLFDCEACLLRQVVREEDVAGGTPRRVTTINYRDLSINQPIRDEVFRCTPPAGAEPDAFGFAGWC